MSAETREVNDLCLATRFVWINGEGQELVLATADGSCMYHALAYRVERRLKAMNVTDEQKLRGACETAIAAQFADFGSVILREVLGALYKEITDVYKSIFATQQAAIGSLTRIGEQVKQRSSWGTISDAANLAGLFFMHSRTVQIEDGRLKYHQGEPWSGYVPVPADGVFDSVNVYHLLIAALSDAPFRGRLRSTAQQDYPFVDKPLLDHIWQTQLRAKFSKIDESQWTPAGLARISKSLAPSFHSECLLWITGASLESTFITRQHNHWNLFVTPWSEVSSDRAHVFESKENSWSPQVFQVLGVGPFKVTQIARYTREAPQIDVFRSLFNGTDLEMDDTKFGEFKDTTGLKVPQELVTQDPLAKVLFTTQNLFKLSLFAQVDFVIYLIREKRMISTNQDTSELPTDVQHSLLTSRPARRQPRWPTYFILVDDHRDGSGGIARALAFCELASPQPTFKQLEKVMRYPAILHPSLDAAYTDFRETVRALAGDNPIVPFLGSSGDEKDEERYEGQDIRVIGPRSIRSSLEIGSWSCNSYRHHVDFLASMKFVDTEENKEEEEEDTDEPEEADEEADEEVEEEKAEAKEENPRKSHRSGFGFVDYEQALPFTCTRDPWYWNNVDYLPPGSIHEIARVKRTDSEKRDLTVRDCASSSVDQWFSAKIRPQFSEQKVMVLPTLKEPLTVKWLDNYACLADATIGLRAILTTHPDWFVRNRDLYHKLLRFDEIKAAPAINGLAAPGINQKNVRYSLLPYMRACYPVYAGVRFCRERCLPHEQANKEHWYAPFSQSPSHELDCDRVTQPSTDQPGMPHALANVMWHYGLYEDYIELVSAMLPGEVQNFGARMAAILADTSDIGGRIQIDRLPYGGWDRVDARVRSGSGSSNTLVIHNSKLLTERGLMYHDVTVTAAGRADLIKFMQDLHPPPPLPRPKMFRDFNNVIASSFNFHMGDYNSLAYLCACSKFEKAVVNASINNLISWYKATPVIGFTEAPREADCASRVCVIEDEKNHRAIFASRSITHLTASTIVLAADIIAKLWRSSREDKYVLAVRLGDAATFDVWKGALCASGEENLSFMFIAYAHDRSPIISDSQWNRTLTSADIVNYFANS